ncbi:MAG: nucleotidyltransferase family protein [Clostridiales bacterium]|nr:nucleotidyltransferase family protein [Clostridiales bacterium]
MKSKDQIIDFLSESKSQLQKEFHITKIGLFGSYARDEQNENSDIDLVVEFEENTENLYDLKIGLKQYIKDHLQLNVDICREKYIKPRFRNRILNQTIYVE